MTNFDDRLQAVLSADDQAYIQDTIDETGYYQSAFASLRGPGSVLRILVWIAVFICSGVLFFCMYKMFTVDTMREQIIYASFMVLANSGQIAFKLWFNMQLNRRAITHEIKRLQLVAAARAS